MLPSGGLGIVCAGKIRYGPGRCGTEIAFQRVEPREVAERWAADRERSLDRDRSREALSVGEWADRCLSFLAGYSGWVCKRAICSLATWPHVPSLYSRSVWGLRGSLIAGCWGTARVSTSCSL